MTFLKINNLSVNYEMRRETVYAAKKVNINVEKGDYLSFGALADSYGIHYPWANAIQAALNYATKACKIGGKWVVYEKMAGIDETLKIKRQYINELSVVRMLVFLREEMDRRSQQWR